MYEITNKIQRMKFSLLQVSITLLNYLKFKHLFKLYFSNVYVITNNTNYR